MRKGIEDATHQAQIASTQRLQRLKMTPIRDLIQQILSTEPLTVETKTQLKQLLHKTQYDLADLKAIAKLQQIIGKSTHL